MGLIDRLKSALGLATSDRTPTGPDDGRAGSRDVDVTVEHEPATASEDAVKGTDTAGAGAASTDTAGAGAASTDTAGADATSADSTTSEVTDADGTAGEADDATSGTDAGTGTADGVDLEEIKGIGPTYADRLREAGVESVADLAAADPEALDEETDIGPTRLANWIEQARQR